MIIERGARPDAPPKPKRARTVLAGVLGVGVGLVLVFPRAADKIFPPAPASI